MSTFKEDLKKSGQSVLDARAQNVYEMTKIEEESYLQEKRRVVLSLQNELNNLKDLSIKSTTSLVVGENFNPKEWVNNRHDIEASLRIAKIEYALAKKVDQEEFPESEGDIKVEGILDEDLKGIE